jgi:hypothetical protein
VTEETDGDELTEWLKHGDFEGWLRSTTKEVILEEIISTARSDSSARGKCWMSWLLLIVISQSLPRMIPSTESISYCALGRGAIED